MFIPIMRYVRVIAKNYDCDAALFAINSTIIVTTEELINLREKASDKIVEIAKATAEAQKQLLGYKEISIDDDDDLHFLLEDSWRLDHTALLDYADERHKQPYSYIDFGDESALNSENADFEKTDSLDDDNIQEILPETSIQETIDYLASFPAIPAMAVWTRNLISDELEKMHYSSADQNIDKIIEELYGLIGYDDDHRDFILKLAIENAIQKNKLSHLCSIK